MWPEVGTGMLWYMNAPVASAATNVSTLYPLPHAQRPTIVDASKAAIVT